MAIAVEILGENYNRLSRVHERYIRQTDDRRATAYSERELTSRSLKTIYGAMRSTKCRLAKCKSAQGQIPFRYPGRRQVRGWSQTCSELEFGLSSIAS